MLLPEELNRLAVVLVRARNPNNIGAVARAMHDFGFSHLRLVNDYTVPLETARSAVDASRVIEAAHEFDSVASAVADCSLVIGTTAVGERALEHPLHTLPEAAQLIRAEISRAGRVALLFGSEKTGLSNHELSHCHWLLTIPMQQHADLRHPSMNLGQAAGVCLYELVRQAIEPAPSDAPASPTAGELERLTALFTQMLVATGYTQRHPANSSEEQIRRLILRIGLSADDLPVWMGILRQILWKVHNGGTPPP
jgi:TrmH family RNA methyltransferase